MNTPRTEQPRTNEPSASTTEELIVQYLDGELHRKELESVLFGRLAVSEDARTLMHEHLLMRGAIRASVQDDRFLLSESLDRRTRSRIEQVLKVMTPGERVAFAEDAPLVRTNLVTRRLQRWSLRPSLAVLALLLAIGTTWFVTRTTENPIAMKAPATANPTAIAPAQTPATAPIASETVTPVAAGHHVIARSVHSTKAARTAEPQSLAQSTPAAPATESKPEESNPTEILTLTKRYGKFLNATEKREIVIGSHDRL